MNERIKLLTEQATKHYPATESSGEFSTFDKEKFAELIVMECSQFLVDKFDFCGNEILAAEELAKNFGVKWTFRIEE